MTVRFRTIWFCDDADGERESERTRERSSRREEVVESFCWSVMMEGDVMLLRPADDGIRWDTMSSGRSKGSAGEKSESALGLLCIGQVQRQEEVANCSSTAGAR